MVSRAIDYRLNWHRNNQDTIFGGEPQMQYNADLHVAKIDQYSYLRRFMEGAEI